MFSLLWREKKEENWCLCQTNIKAKLHHSCMTGKQVPYADNSVPETRSELMTPNSQCTEGL